MYGALLVVYLVFNKLVSRCYLDGVFFAPVC